MKLLTITTITLPANNKMLRVGVGKYMGKWFLRIDLWTVAYRLTYGT